MARGRARRGERRGEPDLKRVCLSGRAFKYGPDGRRLPKPTLGELRQVWDETRAEVMPRFIGTGRRPWAWWAFDCPTPPPWTWALEYDGRAGGVDWRNRNRPAAEQQRAYLIEIGEE